MHAALLSCFSRVRLFATLWTVARQAPLSMGFSRQEHWSGLPCPSAGDFPEPGIEPASPELAGRFFTTSCCLQFCLGLIGLGHQYDHKQGLGELKLCFLRNTTFTQIICLHLHILKIVRFKLQLCRWED